MYTYISILKGPTCWSRPCRSRSWQYSWVTFQVDFLDELFGWTIMIKFLVNFLIISWFFLSRLLGFLDDFLGWLNDDWMFLVDFWGFTRCKPFGIFVPTAATIDEGEAVTFPGMSMSSSNLDSFSISTKAISFLIDLELCISSNLTSRL